MTNPCYALFVVNEARAADDIAALGLECWNFTYRRFRPGATWPLRVVGSRHTRMASRPAVEIRSPLFPGYIFARIPAERFRDVLESPRVVDAVRGASGEPRAVLDSDISAAVLDVLSCAWDEQMPSLSKAALRAGALIVPVNRARARARRKKATKRLRKWLDDTSPQHLARAA